MAINPEKFYDLRSSIHNLHPILAQMRQETPVYKITHLEFGTYPWVLTRYDDCVNLLKDERFTKDMLRRPGIENLDPNNPMLQASRTINRHMLTVDPPDHTRLRSLVHKAFTPKMIRELSGRVHQIATDLIDRVQRQGEMDFMHDFAVPLPITVIAELLGIPIADQERFRGWTQTIVVEGTSRAGAERVSTAMLEFIMYFHQLFEERRANPGEDLITGLLQVEEAGDKLSSQELISMVFLLLVAGHETTVNLLGNGLLALLTHPDQMQKLKSHPELMESAIEEMLRFEGPIGLSTMRWALHDMEFYGETVKAGEMVVASLLAANRDPAVFENPHTFDITRQTNRHIAFGHGIHYCLGAPLARLEGAVAFELLLSRLPDIRLNIDVNDIQWNDTMLLHSMKSLPVRF